MSSRPDSENSSSTSKQDLERARQETSRAAASAAESAREYGKDRLEHAKESAAERADGLAAALDAAADDLESGEGTEKMISGYGHSMAGLMRRLAGGLRDHEIEDFVTELSGFARRSPGTFLAGSVALGFGVSRLLKATNRREASSEEEDEDYDSGYDYDEESFVRGEAVIDEYGMQTAASDQYRPAGEYPPGATGEPAATPKAGDEGGTKQ